MSDFTARWSGRTSWTREVAAPMRAFLTTEAGSSGVLAAAIVAALALGQSRAGLVRRVLAHRTSRSRSAGTSSGWSCRSGSTAG